MTASRTTGVESNWLLSSLSNRLTDLLHLHQPPADAVLIATALIVGLLTGVGSVIFRFLIRGVDWLCVGP